MIQKNQPATRMLFLTMGLACAMMLLIYILLGIYPFGDGTVLTGDLNGQYTSYFSHYKRFFTADAGFSYGFDKSLGGGLLGLFAYYVASPFNLLYLLVPLAGLPLVSSFILFLKIVLACVFMQFFLQKKFPHLGVPGVALSLCYGFMAYSFAYAQNIMWHDVLLLLPLICLGIDKILAGGNPFFYIVTLALSIFANFYIAYMACIFSVVYFAASLALLPKEKRFYKRTLPTFFAGSLVAGGLPMALVLPAVLEAGDAKGGLFGYTFSFATTFSLRRLPEKLVWGSFVWNDVENGLPLLYCGLLPLLLALCFFVSPKTTRKEKLIAGGGVFLFLLTFWLEGFNTLWHGFKAPIWFPFRNSWLFCFVLILLAAAALAKNAVAKKELLISGGILVSVFLLMFLFPAAVSRSKILLSILAILCFAAGLLLPFLISKPKQRLKQCLTWGILGVAALELAMNGYFITNQFEKYTLSGFQDFIENAGGTAAAIQKADPETYRLEKNFYRSLNDTMMLNYYGVSHFGSTQDDAAVDTLYNLGYRGLGSYLYGSTAFADSVLGIRYLFDNGSRPIPAHWQVSTIEAPYPVYANPYAMPLLFTVPDAAANAFSQGTVWPDSFAYQNALYKILSGEDEDLLLPVASTTDDGLYYEVQAEHPGYYYALAVAPGDALYDLETRVNGAPAGATFSADQRGVINLGWLETGETATLEWMSPAPPVLDSLAFACLPHDKLETLTVQANQNKAEFQWEDGKVTAQIHAVEGRALLYTSIPYHPDWHAKINGKEITPQPLAGGLLAIQLETGNNEILLQYKPRGLVPGIAISCCCFVLFLSWIIHTILYKKMHKIQKNK